MSETLTGPLTLTPLGPTIGAEVTGIDLRYAATIWPGG